MIDLRILRADPEGVARALARRGVPGGEVDAVVEADTRSREAAREAETLRAEVKRLSREVAEARRAGDAAAAESAAAASREVGARAHDAGAAGDAAAARLRELALVLPNLPADACPDGAGPEDNVILRTWEPPGHAGYGDHQRVPHWELGASLGILDMERGAKLSGSMFPLYRGAGARLVRALGAFALDRHADAFEEIRPPTLVRTETVRSTGHLPKFADQLYHIERDDLWAIPTAEVPLTSLGRDEILAEADLPMRFSALSACFRREAGAAGQDTRGLLRVHEFDKVEILAYTTPEQAGAVHADLTERAEALLRELGLVHRVVDLCCGDLGDQSRRTFDLEAYAPGCDRWLEVSSVSWFGDYQARRGNIRYRPATGGAPAFVHTLNGSALAWARIWAALVETGRQLDGSVRLPQCLAPYLGGRTIIGEGGRLA